MFTSIDKALVAVIMAVLWIIDQLWGLSWFGEHLEETIGVILAVLMPILVWLVPNRET